MPPLSLNALPRDTRTRILILGSGWAGYTLSLTLDPQKYQAIIISPRSYFVFTPLLASCSVGTLEFRTALEPVRSRNAHAGFIQGWADGVDFGKKRVRVEEAVEGRGAVGGGGGEREGNGVVKGEMLELEWDQLVVAVGSYSQTFGTRGVKENAYFLKDVGDARRIRNRLLSCFEAASLPTTSERVRRQLLHFAVVGGGPTGIEWGAECYDIVHEDMRRLYPELVQFVKITVYDVAPSVLGMFDEKLAQYATKTFQRRGIEVKTSHHVEELRRGVPTGGEELREGEHMYTLKIKEEGEVGVGMCVWSTGLMQNPFIQKNLKDRVKLHDKTGSILTNSRLQAIGPDGSVLKDVYAVGDCAVMEDTNYPATAQVANQKAMWLAKRLNKGDIEKSEFTYKNLGVMAYIGNWNAIVQSGGADISGRVAWFIWRGAYLAKAVSWRNRILIPTYWFVNWLFGRDVSRF